MTAQAGRRLRYLSILIHTKREARDAEHVVDRHAGEILIHTKREARDPSIEELCGEWVILIHTKREARDGEAHPILRAVPK